MAWGNYLVAGAEGAQQERLRKSELAALMQRWQEQQDLQEREFGFRKSSYATAQEQAARARAEAAMRQGVEELIGGLDMADSNVDLESIASDLGEVENELQRIDCTS